MLEEYLLLEEFLHEPRTAYFSMEIALRHDIPTYGGGLGILAGDVARSAADLALPMVFVSIASRAGYFRQAIDAQGQQTEHPNFWDPAKFCTPMKAAVAIPLEGRDVWISAWLFIVTSETGGRVPVILLDTDIAVNDPEDRTITHYLYGGGGAYRLKQEAVLGIGGMRILQALGFDINHYHMNEGHAALLALGLLRAFSYHPEDVRAGESPYAVQRVRQMCSFTTHTPVEPGHDKFPYELVSQVLGDIIDIPVLKALGGAHVLNLTLLALNCSGFVNGVAKRHAEVSDKLFPGYQMRAVTNGVHPFTWTSPSFRRLFDAHMPGWAYEPELLIRADALPHEAVIEAHMEAKDRLIELARNETGVTLERDQAIIGFARRMTAYKRPELLFTDLARLRAIAAQYPFQLVLGGKAHPHDKHGKDIIKRLHEHARELQGVIPIAFIPDYNMLKAATIIPGVDLWLSTPLPPLEASGTSGMKAAFNGVPQLSVLDGWWIEGCIEGVTGWAIGDILQPPEAHAGALYEKLEQVVLRKFYEDRAGWINVMKSTIAKNAVSFNSHRMMRRYVTEAYVG